MAASTRSFLAAIAAALAALSMPGASAQDKRQLPISLEAASTDVDYRANRVRFRDVVVSQGDTSVRAQRAEATGLDFEDGTWVFEDDVRIAVESHGTLRSDRAIVEFKDNRIARARIIGTPAEFEQQRSAADMMARGRAGTIEYTVDDGLVRLAENAWLSDGRNEITGPVLVYDIRAERVQAAGEPGGDQRVRITINPEQAGSGRQKPPQERP